MLCSLTLFQCCSLIYLCRPRRSCQEMNSQAINDFRIQDPNLTPQTTLRRSNNSIEDADLEFGDYVRMQFLGMNIDDAIETSEGLDYRSKLDWELCILDDFS